MISDFERKLALSGQRHTQYLHSFFGSGGGLMRGKNPLFQGDGNNGLKGYKPTHRLVPHKGILARLAESTAEDAIIEKIEDPIDTEYTNNVRYFNSSELTEEEKTKALVNAMNLRNFKKKSELPEEERKEEEDIDYHLEESTKQINRYKKLAETIKQYQLNKRLSDIEKQEFLKPEHKATIIENIATIRKNALPFEHFDEDENQETLKTELDYHDGYVSYLMMQYEGENVEKLKTMFIDPDYLAKEEAKYKAEEAKKAKAEAKASSKSSSRRGSKSKEEAEAEKAKHDVSASSSSAPTYQPDSLIAEMIKNDKLKPTDTIPKDLINLTELINRYYKKKDTDTIDQIDPSTATLDLYTTRYRSAIKSNAISAPGDKEKETMKLLYEKYLTKGKK